MELIAALLTAFLFWLFLSHCVTSARERARQRAGRLLLKLGRPLSYRRWIIALIIAGLLIVAFTVVLIAFEGFDHPMVVFQWAMAVLNFGILPLSMFARIEFRERGILSFAGMGANLLPWHSIKYCKWSTAPQNLFVQCSRSVSSYKIRSTRIERATAVLAQQVELRDVTGKVLNPEFQPPRADAEAEPFRFQFTLRTLLLFVLVASSAFSWAGIRFQRSRGRARIRYPTNFPRRRRSPRWRMP